MTGNTSPGLDGIPGQFYKSYFHIFGTFYTKMVNNCLETGSLPKSWDTTVMKVIPKNTEEAPSFDFLRPLQVPNEDSKICAGMIEHRMSKVSSDVININQTGGVPNRFIQTSTFLIHLLINFCVLLITVNVFKPKKSNLINPAFSAEYISNCVDGNNKLDDASLYKGTVSVNFLSAITTPAACVATFLFNPSSFKDKSINFFTRPSFEIIS